MGFRMILSWIHFGLVLILPALVSLLMGCMRAKEEPADLGPEVSREELDAALMWGTEGVTLDNLREGQYLTYNINRRIENEETTILLGSLKVTVQEPTDNGTFIRFPLLIERQERMADNTFKPKTSEDWIDVSKPVLIPSGQMFAKANAKSTERITYHRLRKSAAVLPPPALVRAKPDCGGLNPCELPVRYVQFDLVQWKNDKDFTKVAVDFTFSAATPFLPFGSGLDEWSGLLISNCQSTYVPISGRSVYVRDCQILEDFQK